ncbi:MarR family winged helix-turn-helix transcriptional regulator [Microbacterium sp. Marseille-Q6965]|uniref:MarR family winged helix-turn-helix transcriptional regulator n=1 Tax=Microbacterium sp. Marseille-Q6965 TaxID=2965072 RepID=UPI0021B7CE7E|nr:MarR family transcriptional regulator [Microbacterium sp. Marseille-Q6965]
MTRAQDVEALILAAHRLARVAALDTRNDTPAAQWRTLAILRESGPQRLGELARLSRVTQPGMTRLIGVMAEAGLVDRTPDPEDSRAVRIAATEKGAAAYAAWRRELVGALLPRFAELDEDDWAAIRRTARVLNGKIAANAAQREEGME